MTDNEWPDTYTQLLPDGSSFDLVLVKGGSFFMGDSDHEIHIPTFYMAKFPVTQVLWKAVMGEESPSYFKGANRPVESVSWYEAAAFCNALNLQCGFLPRYFADATFTKEIDYEMIRAIDYEIIRTIKNYEEPIPIFIQLIGPGYRLPPESNWEYAAIGARQRTQQEYAGGNHLDELGWYEENSHGQTQPVGLKLPNELGIHDLTGNVWEWCEDEDEDEFFGLTSENPKDGSARRTSEHDTHRILRGGCWKSSADYSRFSFHVDDIPMYQSKGVGFRVVCFPQSVNLFSQESP